MFAFIEFVKQLWIVFYVVRGKVMFWHVSVHPFVCPQGGPPHAGGYPVPPPRQNNRWVLDTPRWVCLLRSRRRTFLCLFGFQKIILHYHHPVDSLLSHHKQLIAALMDLLFQSSHTLSNRQTSIIHWCKGWEQL